MEENLGGGWNPAQFHSQWSPDQFAGGELGFPTQAATQYPDFDDLYNQQPEQLAPAQAWPQQQGDYYAGHQNPIGGFGYAHDQSAAPFSTPQPQQAQAAWQSYQPPAQNGYPAAGQYSNPLATSQTGSPSPYSQQTRFVSAEPVPAQAQVSATPVSQQPNGYGIGQGQPVPQQQVLQQQQLQPQPISQQGQSVPQQQVLQQHALQQQAISQQGRYIPSPTQTALTPEAISKEAKLQRMAATRNLSGSAPGPISGPIPVPATPPLARPASVPAVALPPQSVVAPKQTPLSGPATTPVTGPAAIGAPSPAAPSTNEPEMPTIRVESDLRKEHEAKKLVWPGVPNLIVRDTDVQVPRPAMRYTTVVSKGDKSLFKKLPGGPTLGEVLGRHMEAYMKIPVGPEHDDARRLADAIMDVQLRRIGKPNERPKDWYSRAIPGEGRKREIPGWETFSAKNNDNKPEHQRIDAPPTDDMTTVAELFLPHSQANNPNYIRKLVEEYALRIRDAVVALRDNPAYKELGSLIKQRRKEPESVSENDVTKVREKLSGSKEKLWKIITHGLEVKDASVLQELGSRHLVTAQLFNVLSNLVNQDDANSPLAKAILRLVCRFTNLTPSELEVRYKFDDARQKLVREKGDDEINNLVDSLTTMVEKNKDKDAEAKKAAKVLESKVAKTGSPSKKSDNVGMRSASGTKRTREDDIEARTSKKLATGAKSSPSPAPSSSATKPAAVPAKASTSLAAKLAAKKAHTTLATTTAKPAIGALPGKRAPLKPVPKPESSILDLPKPTKSEVTPKIDLSKLEITKPGTAKPAPSFSSTSLSSTKLGIAKKAPPPASSSKSKFASLLDEINKPKPEKRRDTTPPTDPAKPETEEEKTRRLRKQERRRLGLRVTFRSDDRLVEVREFYREEGEEVGNFMTQGVNKSEDRTDEGRALKESHLSDIRPYDDLIPIDFPQTMAHPERGESYTTRGGEKTFRTAEQDFMEDRDKKVLSVVYTSKEDIPPTPKSPILGPSNTDQTGDIWPLPNGTSELDEANRRSKDVKQQGLYKAVLHAQTRQANPVFGQYQNVMENVDAVIRQSLAPRPPPAAVPSHDPVPTASAAADPDRRPVDRNNLSAYLNKFKGTDWFAAGMDGARANALRDMFTTIPWHEFPSQPFDPAKAKTKRRYDYPDPEVQKAADSVEDTFAQFMKEHPGPWQPEPFSMPEPQSQAPAQSQPQVQAQPETLPQAQFQAQLTNQLVQNATQSAHDDHTQAWIRYLQENPQAAGAMYQQQLAQYQASQNAQQSYQPGVGQPAYQQQSAPAFYGQQQPSEPQFADVQAVLAQLQQGSQQPAGQGALANSNAMQRGGSSEGYRNYGSYGHQGARDQGYDPYQPATRNPDTDSLNYDDSGVQGTSHAQGVGRNQGGKHGRKHQRDDHGGPRQGHNQNHGNKRNRSSAGSAGQEDSEEAETARNVNPNKIGTKQCSFWLKGKCAKGDRCTYRHA